MVKFELNSNFKNRFEKFLSSDLFYNQAEHAKTAYWKYHSKKINYSIKNSILTLEGKSGNYIPDKKNSYNFFLRSLKIFIKKIIGIDRSHNLSYKAAFNKIMSEEKNAGFQQVQFDKKRIIAKNISDCKKQFSFNYVINEPIIKSYYYINILNSYMELSKTKFITEIGAGNGNLMLLLKHHFNSKCIIDIDLPETLILCIPFLKNLFPNAKILLPNEINEKIGKDTLLNYDFIFLTPSQITLLEENLIDLFINTSSFMEMNMSQIEEYINFIQKVGKKDSFFFCANSVEKIPVGDGKQNENYKLIKPIRFFEYPFFKNQILLLEICKFTSLVQNNPSYLRLEKLKK
jgi:putative sugar O-methyltransferase